MCNLHWCYTFCTGVTLFALVLHLNCTALSQSESNNFFMYIINKEKCEALTDLRDDNSSIITKTDKGNGVQIINKLDYLNVHLIPKWPQF